MSDQFGEIVLKPGRDKSVRLQHPWLYSGSIAAVHGQVPPGGTVRVISARGEALGWASYSPVSNIRARMWSFDPDIAIDESFFSEALARAISRRKAFLDNPHTNAYRLVHAESDGLPGLIVDRYDDVLVIQILSAGTEFQKDILIEQLVRLTDLQVIYERSDVEVRKLEGLPQKTGPIVGNLSSPRITMLENDLHYQVDIMHGQKTGFYLDQRDNRARICAYAHGKNILNCFSYTGAFCVPALSAGAEKIVNIDSSAEALALARDNILLNGFQSERCEWIEGDVFTEMRKFRDRAEQFDLIVLDPPKFASTVSQVDKAARAYKDINLLGFKLLKPGGCIFTFSCSGGVSPELFQKIVAGAARDAGVQAVILEKLSQSGDHPIALNFPEGEYLKGLVCQK